MADHGFRVVERDSIYYLAGVLDEYADFTVLLKVEPPLRLDMHGVNRFNSIGIRNLLKFLAAWGGKGFEYFRCPVEFIDQLNMIPALLGVKGHGRVHSLYVPYDCDRCSLEQEVLLPIESVQDGQVEAQPCSDCGGRMEVLTDNFFIFLDRH